MNVTSCPLGLQKGVLRTWQVIAFDPRVSRMSPWRLRRTTWASANEEAQLAER